MLSQFHVGVIRNYLKETFSGIIDMEDYSGKPQKEIDNAFLTRSLAALSIMSLGNASVREAADSITDGYGDNGIDAIYYQKSEKILYLVQTKWRNDGTGSVDRGDFQKFIQGVRYLTVPRLEKFNKKVNDKKDVIESALNDADTKCMFVLTYTGQASLSEEIKDDIQLFLEELNDSSEFATFKGLKQKNVYNIIAKGAQGDPINMDVVLTNWGTVDFPHKAYYGQVAASDVASWWNEYYPKLFSPNIRLFLGDTDVNKSIVETLKKEPENFWYFNNGITALCSTIKKKPIGGNSRDTGIFEIEDLKIVNGAQTAGSIASTFDTHAAQVENAKVPIRFISLKDSPDEFERLVTRNTNTQNRIEKRDFVALDPDQERLKDELNLSGIKYLYKSGETPVSSDNSFDITEATIARACYLEGIDLTVQAKREIGKLWDDITKAPYKKLFNSSVHSIELWRLVQVLRLVEEQLIIKQSESDGRNRLYASHGNRFVLHLVYQQIKDVIDNKDLKLSEKEINQVRLLTNQLMEKVIRHTEKEYGDSVLASLFKNITKCRNIYTKYFAKAL